MIWQRLKHGTVWYVHGTVPHPTWYTRYMIDDAACIMVLHDTVLQRELLLQRERGLNRNTTCICYVEVWELKLYFYPSAGGFTKKIIIINDTVPHDTRGRTIHGS